MCGEPFLSCVVQTLLQVSRLAGVDLVRMRAGLEGVNVMVNSHQISAFAIVLRTSAFASGRVAQIILETAERGCLSRSTFDNPKTRGISCAHLAILAVAGGTPTLRSIWPTRPSATVDKSARSLRNRLGVCCSTRSRLSGLEARVGIAPGVLLFQNSSKPLDRKS